MNDDYFGDFGDFDEAENIDQDDHGSFFDFGSDFGLEDWLVIGLLGRIAHNTAPRAWQPPDPREDFNGYVQYILRKSGRT